MAAWWSALPTDAGVRPAQALGGFVIGYAQRVRDRHQVGGHGLAGGG